MLRTNKETNRQTDAFDHSTHADRQLITVRFDVAYDLKAFA